MENLLIKVDGVKDNGTNQEFMEVAQSGIACQGFAMILKVEDGFKVLLHNTNIPEIADAFAESDELMAAAAIAKGFRESKEIMKQHRMQALFGGALKGMKMPEIIDL